MGKHGERRFSWGKHVKRFMLRKKIYIFNIKEWRMIYLNRINMGTVWRMIAVITHTITNNFNFLKLDFNFIYFIIYFFIIFFLISINEIHILYDNNFQKIKKSSIIL